MSRDMLARQIRFADKRYLDALDANDMEAAVEAFEDLNTLKAEFAKLV